LVKYLLALQQTTIIFTKILNMKLITTIAALTILLSACQNNEKSKPVQIAEKKAVPQDTAKPQDALPQKTNNTSAIPPTFGKDTLLVTTKCVVIHNATKAETDKFQKEGGENFGEALSDNLHYLDETKTNAKKKNIAIVETEAKCLVFITQKGERIFKTRGKDFSGWGAMGFNANTPPFTIEIVMSDKDLNKLK
jgi:hypothetical protein